MGALAALRWRDRTGEGQFVEMAQCEGLVRALDWTWLYAGLTGRDRPKAGNRDPVFVPSGLYRCLDGHVAVVAGTDAEFRGLGEALGRPDLATDARFATTGSRRRPEHADLLDALIGAWCATRARADVEAAARRHGFAAAPVMSARDQYEDPHFRARGSVEELDDRVYGRMVDYGPAPQLSATPARHKWAGRPVGWHNRHVLSGILGLPDDEIADLERRGDRRALERPAGRQAARRLDGRGRPVTLPPGGPRPGGPTGRARPRIRAGRPRSRRPSTACSCWTARSSTTAATSSAGSSGSSGPRS